MFDHSKDLSQAYYQVNKVGNLMSLYTNDLETIQECFGRRRADVSATRYSWDCWLFIKMWRMDPSLTLMAMIPAFLMFLVGSIVGRVMTRRWEERQQAFADLSDFAQENFSGIAGGQGFRQRDPGADGFPQAEPGKTRRSTSSTTPASPPC